MSLPLAAAFGFVTRLASGLFSGRRKNGDTVDLESKGEDLLHSQEIINIPKLKDSGDESSSQKSTVIDNSGGESVHGKGEEHVEAKVHDFSVASEGSCNLRTEELEHKACYELDAGSFKRFDIAKDPLDHYFLGASGQVHILLLLIM